MIIDSTSNSPFRERHTIHPFPWKADELRRTARELIARFPNADTADLVRALSMAADSLAPQSGVASLLVRATRVMRLNVPSATERVDIPLDAGTA